MADHPRRDRLAFTVIASSTAAITSAMLCFVYPLFKSMSRDWSFSSLDPTMQMVLLAGICILFAIGAGVTHLHGEHRRRISVVAALVSIAFLAIAFHVVFVSRDIHVVFAVILAFMATLALTSFALLEPLQVATRLALRYPENSGRVLRAITAGILLGAASGAVGYWASSFSIYGLFTTWSVIAVVSAATISRARLLPTFEETKVFSKTELQSQARFAFSEMLFTCVLAMPGTVMLSAESGRLAGLGGSHVVPFFTILGPVSIAIAAVTELIITLIRNRRTSNARSTMTNSYAFLLASSMFIIGASFFNFRVIDVTAWLVHGAGDFAIPILLFILVMGTFWATPVLMAMQRAISTLAKSKLPGWVNGFALGLFWLVISITQAYATEIGTFFFDDLGAWMLGVTLACSVSIFLIIAGVAINRIKPD